MASQATPRPPCCFLLLTLSAVFLLSTFYLSLLYLNSYGRCQWSEIVKHLYSWFPFHNLTGWQFMFNGTTFRVKGEMKIVVVSAAARFARSLSLTHSPSPPHPTIPHPVSLPLPLASSLPPNLPFPFPLVSVSFQARTLSNFILRYVEVGSALTFRLEPLQCKLNKPSHRYQRYLGENRTNVNRLFQ